MSPRSERQSEALVQLEDILRGEDEPIEFILVEGTRDVKALRFLGVSAPIDITSHVRRAEHAVAYNISTRTRSVLILTDFDRTGVEQANRLTELLMAEGVRVQVELRRKIGRLLGVLDLKTIESIDNLVIRKEVGQFEGP